MTFPLLGYMCTIHLTKSPGAFDCPFSGNDSNDFIVASFFSFLLPGRVSTGCFESVQLTYTSLRKLTIHSRIRPTNSPKLTHYSLIVFLKICLFVGYAMLASLLFISIISLYRSIHSI